MKVVVAITGASGAAYGARLLQILKEQGVETGCIVSRAAKLILKHEGVELPGECYDGEDIEAPLSSGSHAFDALVIAPCSMKTLAAVANGYASNLVTRCADVAVKEGRKLVLVPRETPLSSIHLENMLKLARIGVTILPAMPAFYPKPRSLEDMIDFVVGKVLDTLGVGNSLYGRWGE